MRPAEVILWILGGAIICGMALGFCGCTPPAKEASSNAADLALVAACAERINEHLLLPGTCPSIEADINRELACEALYHGKFSLDCKENRQ